MKLAIFLIDTLMLALFEVIAFLTITSIVGWL